MTSKWGKLGIVLFLAVIAVYAFCIWADYTGWEEGDSPGLDYSKETEEVEGVDGLNYRATLRLAGISAIIVVVTIYWIGKRRKKKMKKIEDEYRFRWEKGEHGIILKGEPIYIKFEEEIEDIDELADTLTNTKKPFRLGGAIRKVDENLIEIKGVDLPTKAVMNLEITPKWIGIYLRDDSASCVLRLIDNIWKHITPKFEVVDANDNRVV